MRIEVALKYNRFSKIISLIDYGRCDQTKSEYQDSWSVHHTRTRMSSILGAIRLDG